MRFRVFVLLLLCVGWVGGASGQTTPSLDPASADRQEHRIERAVRAAEEGGAALLDLTRPPDDHPGHSIGERNPGSVTNRLLVLTGVFILLSAGILMFLSLRVQKIFWSPATTETDATWRTYLTQLPLGAPEGSVRALISIYVIVFGLLVLVLQNQLALANGDAISGFVGIVITFYFTSRAGDQNARAASSAADAASQAANQAQVAVAQTRSQVGDAVAAVNQVMQRTHGATIALQNAIETVQHAAGPPGQPDLVLQGQSGLRQVKADLQIANQVLGTLDGFDEGTGVVSHAAGLTRAAGGLIDVIDPLLSGTPDAGKIGDVLGRAQDMLGAVQNAGLPGVLGDAVAGLGGTLGALAPIVNGLSGGPVGLVGGIVLSGIKLMQQREQFDAWETALLRKPLTRSVMPPAVDGTAALAALDPALAPLMSARIGSDDPALATELMRELLRTDNAGDPLPTAALAAELFAPGQGLGLRDRFHSEQELAEAISQYRGSLVFVHARSQLAGSIDIPALGDQPARSVGLADLVTAAGRLAVDPRSGSEIERLVYLVRGLAKLDLGPDRLSGLAEDALGKAVTLATQHREQTDQRQ